MRSSSCLAILCGMMFLCFLAAMPSLLTWQAQTILAPYGALDKVNLVVQTALDDARLVRILGAINSVLVTMAGVLIGFRRKSGYYLLIGLCGLAVAVAVFAFVEAQSIPGGAVVQFFLWGFMLAFVLRKNQRYGATWWRENAPDSA